MSSIGPKLPPHLMKKNENNDNNSNDNNNSKTDKTDNKKSINDDNKNDDDNNNSNNVTNKVVKQGPQLPPHLLKRKRTSNIPKPTINDDNSNNDNDTKPTTKKRKIFGPSLSLKRDDAYYERQKLLNQPIGPVLPSNVNNINNETIEL